MNAWSHLDSVKLSHKAVGEFIEFLSILRLPPFIQITVFIKMASLVVEAVGHLMTYDNSYCAVIDGVVGSKIEIRGLKDSGREANLVVQGGIIGIDSLRSPPHILHI